MPPNPSWARLYSAALGWYQYIGSLARLITTRSKNKSFRVPVGVANLATRHPPISTAPVGAARSRPLARSAHATPFQGSQDGCAARVAKLATPTNSEVFGDFHSPNRLVAFTSGGISASPTWRVRFCNRSQMVEPRRLRRPNSLKKEKSHAASLYEPAPAAL